jgi:hypothetical protein
MRHVWCVWHRVHLAAFAEIGSWCGCGSGLRRDRERERERERERDRERERMQVQVRVQAGGRLEARHDARRPLRTLTLGTQHTLGRH